MKSLYLYYLFVLVVETTELHVKSSKLPSCSEILDIPASHIPPFNSRFNHICDFNEKCYDTYWGYEVDVPSYSSFSNLYFTRNNTSFCDNFESFFKEADFGYIREPLISFMTLCEPLYFKDSSLVCSSNLRFCTGRNIYINFEGVEKRKSEDLRYKMDILSPTHIGGQCTLHSLRLKSQLSELSPLQSWGPELRNFVQVSQLSCDISIKRPTYVVKLDAVVNIYHHFCDFFNLYATLHLNSTNNPHMYSRDVNILIWENRKYTSNLESVFRVFSKHPFLYLDSFAGKQVCFSNLVFSLLPRMLNGLFYNSYLSTSCSSSSLFKAFKEFVLHRLRLTPFPPSLKKNAHEQLFRITFIVRETPYRRILNQGELIESLLSNSSYSVNIARFNHKMDFTTQLSISMNTDILIGIHGAGLTHTLFLPQWAVLFEIYHCEDPKCYSDLAKLTGVKYMTWSNDSSIIRREDLDIDSSKKGAHAKFMNYIFDKNEFLSHVSEAASHVKSFLSIK